VVSNANALLRHEDKHTYGSPFESALRVFPSLVVLFFKPNFFLIKRLLLFKFLFFKVLNILDPGVCFLRSTTLLIKYPDSHSDSLIIFKLMSGRGKFTLGVLLKTNYERGSVFKLFMRGVCSSTDVVRGTGDIGVPPPLQMAKHAELEGVASDTSEIHHTGMPSMQMALCSELL